MKVLVFNCGSSSLKYKLLEMPGRWNWRAAKRNASARPPPNRP